jgi:RimJ/RimL family protein N-acetyltransferase
MSSRAFEIPVLETPRLILRPHRLSDFEASFAMWSDPIVVRHITGKPSTEQASWGRMMNYLGLWHLLGFGYWAVEEKSSGQLVGEFGFADFKRDLQPSIRGLPELGWALASHVHGKGYATEGLRAALAWGDANLKASRVVCLIDPENLASFKVAAKLGFMEQAKTTYGGKPTVLYSRERPAKA